MHEATFRSTPSTSANHERETGQAPTPCCTYSGAGAATRTVVCEPPGAKYICCRLGAYAGGPTGAKYICACGCCMVAITYGGGDDVGCHPCACGVCCACSQLGLCCGLDHPGAPSVAALDSGAAVGLPCTAIEQEAFTSRPDGHQQGKNGASTQNFMLCAQPTRVADLLRDRVLVVAQCALTEQAEPTHPPVCVSWHAPHCSDPPPAHEMVWPVRSLWSMQCSSVCWLCEQAIVTAIIR